MSRNAKILLIEDSKDYQILISETLSPHSVRIAGSAKDALHELHQTSFDLILLDIGLPDKSGFTLLSEIQSNPTSASIPIICITGKNGVSDKVTAFSLGADDYLPKPFDLAELKARVDSKLMKYFRQNESTHVIRIGNLKLDLNSHLVTISGQGESGEEILLTQTEFKLLVLFSKHPSRLFTRQKILQEIRGNSIKVSDRVIDVHLCSLRKKIKDSNLRITPVTGEGYRLTISSLPDQSALPPLSAT